MLNSLYKHVFVMKNVPLKKEILISRFSMRIELATCDFFLCFFRNLRNCDRRIMERVEITYVTDGKNKKEYQGQGSENLKEWKN